MSDSVPTTPAGGRSALLPAAGIPLLYFAFAHLCVALAFGALLVMPSLPGGFFFHPRMVAVVHLVTLGWITGSILGAFHIVGPLALGLPLRPAAFDRIAFGSFVLGVSGIVAHFWIGEYTGMAWSALLVIVPVLQLARRIGAGLRQASVPWPVALHIGLAFTNMIAASALGTLIGLNRLFGWLPWAPISAAYAHAHVAAVGWAMMMVVGLSYRLIPMILPAAMPAGRSIAASAVLLQAGVTMLAVSLIRESNWTIAGSVLIIAGLGSFVWHVRWMLRRRRPRAAGLPHPDWATWQTHAAFVWLLATAVLGVLLSVPVLRDHRLTMGWWYGTLGLVGFLSQIILGMQGRLLPLHAWYRAFEAADMRPPARSAHERPAPWLALVTLGAWTAGIPVLGYGLSSGRPAAIAVGSGLLLAGVIANAAYGALTVALQRPARAHDAHHISAEARPSH